MLTALALVGLFMVVPVLIGHAIHVGGCDA